MLRYAHSKPLRGCLHSVLCCFSALQIYCISFLCQASRICFGSLVSHSLTHVLHKNTEHVRLTYTANHFADIGLRSTIQSTPFSSNLLKNIAHVPEVAASVPEGYISSCKSGFHIVDANTIRINLSCLDICHTSQHGLHSLTNLLGVLPCYR